MLLPVNMWALLKVNQLCDFSADVVDLWAKVPKLLRAYVSTLVPVVIKKKRALLSLTFVPNAAVWITIGSCSLCTRPVHCAITLGAFGVLSCYVRHAEAHFSSGWQAAFSSHSNLKNTINILGILIFCVHHNDNFMPAQEMNIWKKEKHPPCCCDC